jgi:glycogen debranching enzyme
MEDVNNLVTMMKDDWNVLSLTDLVLNHTANESPWLKEHPECSYNMINSPHLKPAYLLDRILWHFSLEVGEGKWAASGVPPELRSETHLQVISNPESWFDSPAI